MKKFFQGLSLSSIVAGTLAAVTSFLLSAKIGLAGSVIGAAISYIVSSVATNIYKNVLTASGEKLQAVSGVGNADDSGQSDEQTADEPAEQASNKSGESTEDAGQHNESGEDGKADADSDESKDADDRTRTVSGIEAAARKPREIISNRESGRTYSVAELRRARKPRNPKRMAVIVTLVSGLLAVAISAGVVMLLTRGQGTDSVVRDWNTPTVTTPTDTDTDTDTQTNLPTPPNDSTNQQGTDSSKDSTSTDSTDGTDSSESTNTGGSTESNGTSSGTNSGSTGTNGSTDSGTNSGSTGTDSGSTDSGTTDSGTNSGTTGSTDSSTGSTSGSTGSGSGTSSNTGSDSGTGIKAIG